MSEHHVAVVPRASGQNYAQAVENLRNAIGAIVHRAGQDGWRFTGQVSSVTYENPGCIAALLGRGPIAIPVNFLLFER